MARPKTPVARKTENKGSDLSSWFKNRKERKRLAEEEAAQNIVNDAASNENSFISILQGIGFEHSKLPKDKLEYRTNPNQPCGDLENTALWLAQQLRSASAPVSIDIRELDKKLKQLVLSYKQSVEQGFCNEAFAAMGALIDTFSKIRFRLPQVLPQGVEEEYARAYVDSCATYIDTWIDLLAQARAQDEVESALKSAEKELERRQAQHKAELDAFEKLIESDPGMLEDYHIVSTADSQTKLTPSQLKLKEELIEQGIRSAVVAAAEQTVNQLKISAETIRGRVNMLKVAISGITMPSDPNAMNRYKDDIARMKKQLSARDQEIEESLKDFDEIRGAMEAMDHLPGAVYARQTAARAAIELIDEVRQRQALKDPASGMDYLKAFGLKTREELDIQQKAIDENYAKLTAGLYTEERQANYN